MRVTICTICAVIGMHLNAQQRINLAGQWQFSMGENPRYTETVDLPGSMLTNGKGLPVSVKTPWTGSLYDSSYYYNPYMEKYWRTGNVCARGSAHSSTGVVSRPQT